MKNGQGWLGREGGVTLEEQQIWSLWWRCSVSWFDRHQYPGCDVVLLHILCWCYDWGNLGEEHRDVSVLYPIIACKSTMNLTLPSFIGHKNNLCSWPVGSFPVETQRKNCSTLSYNCATSTICGSNSAWKMCGTHFHICWAGGGCECEMGRLKSKASLSVWVCLAGEGSW